jgi:hypothetical protein
MDDLQNIAERLAFTRAGRASEWRGDCPSCGYKSAACLTNGKDGRPALFCASCSDGRELRRILRDAAGGDAVQRHATVDRVEQARDLGSRIRKARDLWDSAIPICGTLAERYLHGRGVLHALRLHQAARHGPALRFLPRCWSVEAGKHLPAMVAAIRDPASGDLLAVQRTYLAQPGIKAPLHDARRSLGPARGGAVMLHAAPLFGPLVLAEGVETACAASIMLKAPAWAAVSAGNLADGVALPADVRDIIIAADPDPPGERAAQEAAERWLAEGRKVRIATPDDNNDFNTLLMRRAAREASHG